MTTTKQELDNARSQMRKGILEYCVLLLAAKEPIYANDILKKLKAVDLLVVEGTLYPLLSRMKNAGWLTYDWEESPTGPPRKYYRLTAKGQTALARQNELWDELTAAIKNLK